MISKKIILVYLIVWLLSSSVMAEEYNRGLVMSIVGKIHSGNTGELLTTNPKTIRRLHLNSIGGKVESAILMAQYVRKIISQHMLVRIRNVIAPAR